MTDLFRWTDASPSGSPSPRPRWRRPSTLVAIAIAVVVAAVVTVLVVVRRDDDTAERLAAATAVAGRWADAWEQGDVEGLTQLATGDTAGLADAVASFTADLAAVAVTVDRGEVTLDDDLARAALAVQVDLGGDRRWTYETAVELVPVEPDDEWRVRWSPPVLHPALGAGRRVVTVASWPERGRVLDTTGVPLTVTPTLRAVVGSVAPATAEQAAALGRPYAAGQPVGASGLQRTHEQLLAGQPRVQVQVLEGESVVETLLDLPGAPPGALRTTLDPRVQAAAEQVLASPIPDARRAAQPAAIVAIDPATGGVLAVASRPVGGFDRALQGRYPPGSVFKIVTTLALLQSGVTPDSPASCPAEAFVGGRRFVNAEGSALGDVPFATAFVQSCNTAMVQLGARLDPARLVDAARALGIEHEPQLGTPAATGSAPLPAGPAEQAAMAIGQGRVLVTPLAMANVAATVASGAYRPPRLVDDGPPPAGEPLPPGAAETIAELMRRVVAEGTGTAARVPGPPLAGKTGTAEFGTGTPPDVHAWFVGFREGVAVAAVVEDADGFGGDVAAPMVAELFRRLG